MIVHRLCREPHTALDGEGARLFGGRWNSPGRSAVYTSQHLSLAVLEYLVHVDPDNLPLDLVQISIEVPDASSVEEYSGPIPPSPIQSVSYGDGWLDAIRTVVLVVPSVVLLSERNLILNPRHFEMRDVTTIDVKPFEFDDRLFKR